jgi:DNA-binding NarL/FixJ family response regulator
MVDGPSRDDHLSMTAAAIRVLVVDDHPAVRAGMQCMLEREPGIVVVGAVATAGEAHAMWPTLERTPVDVVLVDHHLPDEDGLSLCLWLTTRAPAPAVVIAAATADEALALPAAVAGASAVWAKTEDPFGLPRILNAVVAGERSLPAVSPSVGAVQAARLPAEDLPILGMLRHGVAPAEIETTLRMADATLSSRRWAMLEVLSGSPNGDGRVRRVPRIQTIRRLSPSTATTSPGWS